jgi:hypothetical protein
MPAWRCSTTVSDVRKVFGRRGSAPTAVLAWCVQRRLGYRVVSADLDKLTQTQHHEASASGCAGVTFIAFRCCRRCRGRRSRSCWSGSMASAIRTISARCCAARRDFGVHGDPRARVGAERFRRRNARGRRRQAVPIAQTVPGKTFSARCATPRSRGRHGAARAIAVFVARLPGARVRARRRAAACRKLIDRADLPDDPRQRRVVEANVAASAAVLAGSTTASASPDRATGPADRRS